MWRWHKNGFKKPQSFTTVKWYVLVYKGLSLCLLDHVACYASLHSLKAAYRTCSVNHSACAASKHQADCELIDVCFLCYRRRLANASKIFAFMLIVLNMSTAVFQCLPTYFSVFSRLFSLSPLTLLAVTIWFTTTVRASRAARSQAWQHGGIHQRLMPATLVAAPFVKCFFGTELITYQLISAN